MATPTTDEQLDAIATDVELGVKSTSTAEESTTLESPTERIEAARKVATARASATGWGGLVHAARAIPPGSGPE